MSGLLLGSIRATLDLDNSGFNRPLLESQALVSIFGQTAATALANPVLAGIGALKSLGAAALDEGKRLIDMAENSDRLAKQTGITSEVQQTLRRVLQEQGQAAEGADAALLKYTTKLGDARKDGGQTVTTLRQLGIEIGNLPRGDKGLLMILDQLAGITDETQRAAAATEVFDRTYGPALATALAGGSKQLEELKRKYIEVGVVIDNSAVAQIVKIDDALDSVNRSLDGIKTASIAAILEGFAGTGTGDAVANIEAVAASVKGTLVPAARELGSILAAIIKYFDDFKAGIDAIKDPVFTLTQHPQGNVGMNPGPDYQIISPRPEIFSPGWWTGNPDPRRDYSLTDYLLQKGPLEGSITGRPSDDYVGRGP